MANTNDELVSVLLEVDRTKRELEEAMERNETVEVIRGHYDRFIEVLAKKKGVGL